MLLFGELVPFSFFRTQGHGADKGGTRIEKATHRIRDTIGGKSGKVGGEASQFRDRAGGKASELKDEAKARAEYLKQKANEESEEATGKA